MIDGIFLIMSSAYVDQEVAAEFGLLPPVFLPLGNKRLYEAQLGQLDGVRDIVLTIPEDFAVPVHDQKALGAAGVRIMPLPGDLSLGEAVVYAINCVGNTDRPIRILHGDTLMMGLPLEETDIVASSEDVDAYRWAELVIKAGRIERLETPPQNRTTGLAQPVVSGYFAFSSAMKLVRAITKARNNFIEGINLYAKERELRAVQIDDWFDFGHLQTLFRSRRAVTTARFFNKLKIDEVSARKSAATEGQYFKIRAEAEWLRSVPPTMQVYTGRLLDSGETEHGPQYTTEYEYTPTVSELFVFGAISRMSWQRIIRSCADFLGACSVITHEAPAGNWLNTLTVEKTEARLEAYAKQSGFDLKHGLSLGGRAMPSLLEIAHELAAITARVPDRPACAMHGDFCFSNILFNFRTRRIRVLDPRGFVMEGNSSIYGDLRYDLAKLSHSVIGRYDQIIAGRFSSVADGKYSFDIELETLPHHGWVQTAFENLVIDGVAATGVEVRSAMIGLFLSMLPLHADRPDRQRAFIANALRLYAGLEGQVL